MSPASPTRSGASAAPREHLSGYQARDYEVVDYHLEELAGTGLWFRGPLPDTRRGEYFTCIGAAQTFGCFCADPYPSILARELALPALNLGYGGAGPEFFARQTALLDYVNRGRFLILQVMSGRSQSNSRFESGGLEYLRRRGDGAAVGANQAYTEILAGPAWLRRLRPHRVMRRVACILGAPAARRLAAETRAAWIESHRRLLEQVKVPTVLLWFSRRAPDYALSTRSLRGFFGEFPQLIDRPTVDAVRSLVPHYVECVTTRGTPQLLISRFTGAPVTVDPARDRADLAGGTPWTHNHYYPTPDMQQDAAAALLPSVRDLARPPVSA
jgi:hypothetical protein